MISWIGLQWTALKGQHLCMNVKSWEWKYAGLVMTSSQVAWTILGVQPSLTSWIPRFNPVMTDSIQESCSITNAPKCAMEHSPRMRQIFNAKASGMKQVCLTQQLIRTWRLMGLMESRYKMCSVRKVSKGLIKNAEWCDCRQTRTVQVLIKLWLARVIGKLFLTRLRH